MLAQVPAALDDIAPADRTYLAGDLNIDHVEPRQGEAPAVAEAGRGGGGNARAPGLRELDRKVARPGGSAQNQHLVALLDVTKRGALQGLRFEGEDRHLRERERESV